MKKTYLALLASLLILVGCSERKMPGEDAWKGILHLEKKGDNKIELSFDFEQSTGIFLMPDLIPIPLDLHTVKEKNDSVWFSVDFRSGPAQFSALRTGDTIRGFMYTEHLDPTPFWLSKNEERISLYDQPKPPKDQPIVIKTKSQTATELDTKVRLEKLLKEYDLEPYLYTKEILIQDSTIPHSHPVLTMTTRDSAPDLILSTFVHEQMHWYTLHKNEVSEEVMEEIKKRYPKVPIKLPEGGGSEYGTHLHLVVNYLEYEILIRELGQERAKAVMDHWSNHHYTWIYKQVLKDYDELGELLESHGLNLPKEKS
ncbi:hypothetical protein KFE98_18460 [bacterium SCSIO 12741]|nr:hypothetical protein KFE98_18460 [bacterium SCSIO 12741]